MNQLNNANRSLLTILMVGCFMVVQLVMSSSAFAGAPPVMAITDPVNSQTINSVPYTVRGTCTGGSGTYTTITIDDGSGPVSVGTISPWSYAWSPADATYSLNGSCTDSAAKTGTATAVTGIIVSTCTDTDVATMTISDPTESATIGGLYTVYGQVGVETTPLTMGTVQFSLNGGAWTNATGNNGSNAFTISWDTTLVADGPATVQVRGFDPDCGGTNLITSAVRNVTISNACNDTDLAVVTINPPAESATVSGIYRVKLGITGETVPGGLLSVQFSINGGAYVAATGWDGSNWYYDWDTTVITGPIAATINARVTDPDCSTVVNATQRNVTIDNSGPSNTLADCASCHNYPPVDAGSRDATTGNFIGDHDKHNTYTCATCHVTPATESSIDFAHRTGKLSMDTGNIGVGADNGTYSKGTEFNQVNTPTGGTCSVVDCHSNAITPQWGVGATACNSCHALPPATGAHTSHYTAKGWATGVETNCTQCHPNNATGHSDVTDSAAIVTRTSTVYASGSCSGTGIGLGCHNEYATPIWGSGTATCASCHTAGGAKAGDPITGLHATTNLTDHDGTLTGGTGLACEKCHTASPSSLHYNGTVNNGGTATFAWNTANIPAGYNRTSDFCAAVCHTDNATWNREWSGVTDAAWAYTNDAATTLVCGNCHGSFFTGWNIIGATSHDNPDIDNDPDTLATSKASHSECSACHAWGHTNYITGNKHENNLLEMNSALDTSPGDGNCTTTCHSPLTLTFPDANSGWTDASVAGDGVVCGGCHTGGVTTASASGAHTVHGATAASVAANPTSIALCIECHGNDGTGASHNNGTVNFVGAAYSAARGVLTGTCSTTSCHNQGTDQSTAWNTTALACDDCHYYSVTPTSAGNTAHARPLSTSHNDHFTAGKLCTQCHGADPAAGDTTHINGGTTANSDKATALQDEATLLWTHASAVTDYTFNDTDNTCYSPTNNGLGCHATAGAAGAADATRPDWDVAFASTACTNCHTNTTNALVNPTSGLHGAGLTATNSVTGQNHDDSFGTGGTCASCHTTIPVAGTHKDGVFAGGAGQTSTMGLAAFYTQTANDTGTCATTACHMGNSDAWAHKWMTPANYTNATASCTGCHGNLASGWNAGVDHLTGEIATDHADDGTASNYGCEACHALQASTNVYPFTFGTADWAPLNAGNKHGNNLITMNDDGGGTISNWQRGTGGNSTKSMCLKCHTTWTDSAPQHWFVNTSWTPEEIVGDGISAGHGVGAACVSCHDGMTQGTRRNVGLEFDLTRQHGTATPTSADCEKCHDEASGPDGVIQLKVWNSDNSTFTTATYSSTDLSSANTHCLSCHDASRGLTIGGLSAPARSMANYTSTTTYNNHNFTTATGAVVPQRAKAISPHGNPGGNKLKAAADTAVTTAVGCMHCHPSHGSSVASKAATADANGTAMTAKMLGGKPSELASVGYDYASEGTLGDPNLCWGCHDNKGVADYYGDTTTGHWNTTGVWKSPTFTYKTNKGGVLSVHVADKVDGGTADNTLANVVCTTCHDVHGSPTVAQFYSPALKGKWLTSPYYEDRAPPSKTATTNGLFAWANANSTARSANDAYSPRAAIQTGTGWAPKEVGGGYGVVGTQNGAFGWFIDGNTFGMSAYQPYTTGAVTQKYMSTLDATAGAIGTFGGLCMTACHSATNIEARTTWTGHNPVVPGFGGADAATDLFNVNGTTNPATAAKVRNQMVGQGWYNNGGYGQDLFATGTGGERQGGDGATLDARTYSHSKAFSYGVNPITAAAQTGYHQFPCSKCHTPHASVLPALMRTNCLNTARTSFEWRMAAEANNCHRVETTGGYIGAGDPYPGTGYPTTHGGVTNGGWNAVTPW